ncbi:hypothetical protein ABZW10_24730 [Kitasatospora sp. NPDC004723]|uniref:telomere-protecting terminal protein Tpg n=1 Tax=Kitasatospora sp. NPDC004723 TaxID=3154288 RepID=UPI0033A412B3
MAKANARKVEQAVRAAWQPRVKKRVRRDAEKNGFTLHIAGTFGFSAAAGSTDDPRRCSITQRMPGEAAQALYAARDAGADQAEREQIPADALGEHCFRQGGRARCLDVGLNDIAWMDLEL